MRLSVLKAKALWLLPVILTEDFFTDTSHLAPFFDVVSSSGTNYFGRQTDNTLPQNQSSQVAGVHMFYSSAVKLPCCPI